MRIPGIKLLRQNTRWLRSRLRVRAIILGYHRVIEVDHDPLNMCVDPNNFAAQMEIICNNANPIGLEELVHHLQNGAVPQNSVAITFDDGYADILYNALPIIEYYGVKATVFVTIGFLGKEFWWDTLIHSNEYNNIFENKNNRSINLTELTTLASNNLISIASHSINHLKLADQPLDRQKFEIIKSKEFLEKFLGYKTLGFSYPHGSVSRITSEIVRSCGYKFACSSHNDVVCQDSDLFVLPRFWIPNWGADRFRNWINKWL